MRDVQCTGALGYQIIEVRSYLKHSGECLVKGVSQVKWGVIMMRVEDMMNTTRDVQHSHESKHTIFLNCLKT